MGSKKNNLLMGRGDPLLLAMLVGFFQSFAIGCVTLGIVYYAADRFKATSATIGLLGAAYTASYALSCLVLNKLISRLKPYVAVFLGVLMQVILAQLIIRVNSLFLLGLLFFGFGISTGFLWPPLMGWMSRNRDGELLNRAMAKYNMSWSLPWMISPYVTGLLYEKSSTLPFQATTLFSILVLILIVSLLLLRKEMRETGHSEHKIKKAVSSYKDNSTPLRFLTWIGIFPSFFLLGIFGSVFPIFLRDNFALPESQVGLIVLIRATVTLVFFIWGGKTIFWHFNKRMILLSTPLWALLLGVSVLSHSLIHYILWTALVGVIIGYAYINSMFHCLSGAIERQKRMNTHEIVLTSAMLGGNLMGGFLLDAYGMNSIILFSMVMMLLAGAIQFLVSKKQGINLFRSENLKDTV